MIAFDDALNLTLSFDVNLSSERININKVLNRVIAEDVLSDINMPPFNKSAMDGFAFKKNDVGCFCDIIEVIPAGYIPQKEIKNGECSKIMTGAPLPAGADCVVRIEDIEQDDAGRVRCVVPQKSDNICYAGEDFKTGQLLLKTGTLLKPSLIPVLASAGLVCPKVFRQIRVAVISTGDELVEPYTTPGTASIRNSNAYQILAQCEASGALTSYMGIAPDDETITTNILKEAVAFADVVLLSGGVSMGDYDFVPEVMKSLGAEIIFKSVAIQPGRPSVFAKLKDKFIFGLPGNPVSSFVVFEILVKPLIMKLMGAVYNPLQLQLHMGSDYSRRNTERLAIIPVNIVNGNEVLPAEYHGSAHINSYTGIDGIAFIPTGVQNLKKGENVNVRLL